MIQLLRNTLLILIVGVLLATDAAAESRITNFAGRWTWALYADDKSELPPAYRHLPLYEVPAYSLDLAIKQKGNRLTVTYSSTYNYQSRIEDGEASTSIKEMSLISV